MREEQPIAVVGVGCRFPDAPNPGAYWDNILRDVYSIRPMPPSRFNRTRYFDPELGAYGKSYCELGGLIDDHPFDARGIHLPPKVLASTDLAHLWALEVARATLDDAGFEPGQLAHQNVGVIIGHARGSMMTADMAFAESEIDEQQWHDFEKIALAMRDGTWKPSDPRKVSDWFNTSVQRHGSQLRRVCRYIKGMRDFHWTAGGPSSVLLMICATQSWQGFEDRDDLALLHILEEIGPMLLGPVYCPEISDEDFNRIKEIERHVVKNWTDTAAVVLKDVINNSRMHQLQEAFDKLQFTIDHRIPTAPELVCVDSTPASIRAYAPAIVPQKRHEESRAG